VQGRGWVRLSPGGQVPSHPVKDMEWVLDNNSATVLIFGVTAK
jgi:hypothetical protein